MQPDESLDSYIYSFYEIIIYILQYNCMLTCLFVYAEEKEEAASPGSPGGDLSATDEKGSGVKQEKQEVNISCSHRLLS